MRDCASRPSCSPEYAHDGTPAGRNRPRRCQGQRSAAAPCSAAGPHGGRATGLRAPAGVVDAAGHVRVRVVGVAGDHERRQVQVVDRPVVPPDDAQGLARVVVVDADPALPVAPERRRATPPAEALDPEGVAVRSDCQRGRPPVPGPEQLGDPVAHGRRPPRLGEDRLEPGDVGEQAGVEARRPARGRVGERHHRVAGARVRPERGEEAGHRPAVADVRGAGAVVPHHGPDLGAEAVAAPAVRPGPERDRLAHLRDRVRRQHAAAVPGQRGGPARKVGDRRPPLARRAHRAGVVLGLGQQQVRPRVHREPARRGRPGSGRRPAHPEGLEQLGPHALVPRPAPEPRNHLAEHPVSHAGVVEAGAGARFPYSIVGYGVLGEMVARLRGRSWDECVRTELLEQLGMGRTTTRPGPPAARGFAVHPWADLLLAEPEHDAGAMGPAGQLWSTVADLSRWAAALAGDGGGVLAPDTVAEMREPVALRAGPDGWGGHGLGPQVWPVVRDDGTRATHVGHGGSMPGFLATLRADPGSGDAVVAFANATAGWPAGLDTGLLADVAGLEPVLPEPWRPSSVGDGVSELLGPWYWGPTPLAVRSDRDAFRIEGLGGRGRASAFRRDGERWVGIDDYYAGETLRVVRRDDGSIDHLDLASFVITRDPYDPDADVPGGVDDSGWRA